MPELPEVEVTRLSFADRIAGARIVGVRLGKPLRWALGCEPETLVGRVVQGVRIDHVDGLVDPEGYLGRLRGLVGTDRLVVVEKILASAERLPSSWPVDGTTGYDALARLDEAAIRTQLTLSQLNFGQNVIFSLGIAAAMALAKAVTPVTAATTSKLQPAGTPR